MIGLANNKQHNYMPPMSTVDFTPLKALLPLKIHDDAMLKQVFIHRSYVNEHKGKKLEHNERLEFLGDAVLELVTTEYLYKNFPHPEGELTNWRSALVKGENLAKVAENISIGQFLHLSRGEEKSGGREKAYLLANTVEALIGYLYLMGGYTPAQLFIHRHILVDLQDILENKLHIDAKSFFQETAQELLSITPTYKLVSDEGPDHDKVFTMGVYLEDELIAEGKGSSKQSAEQDAAHNGLAKKGWEIKGV
jgi:ribonuclease III